MMIVDYVVVVQVMIIIIIIMVPLFTLSQVGILPGPILY